jgi:hypothetical protein
MEKKPRAYIKTTTYVQNSFFLISKVGRLYIGFSTSTLLQLRYNSNIYKL